MDNDKHLRGQQRPTVEQIAWVFSHIDDAIREPGTFRYLIHDRLGCDAGAYYPLYEAGGMNITNAFCDLEDAANYKKMFVACNKGWLELKDKNEQIQNELATLRLVQSSRAG